MRSRWPARGIRRQHLFSPTCFAAYEIPAGGPEEDLRMAGSRCTTPRANSAGILRKGYKGKSTDVSRDRGCASSAGPHRSEKPGARRSSSAGGPAPYVLGLDVADSEALLDALWAHATQPRFCHAP